MEVRWSPQSLRQLSSARDFIAEDSLSAANRQAETIVRAVMQLADYPEMGRPGRIAGTRELVIQGTSYIAAYRIRAQSIRVLALLHGARRWPTYL